MFLLDTRPPVAKASRDAPDGVLRPPDVVVKGAGAVIWKSGEKMAVQGQRAGSAGRFHRIVGGLLLAGSTVCGVALLPTPVSAAPTSVMFATHAAANNSWTEIAQSYNAGISPTTVSQGSPYRLTVAGANQIIPSTNGGVSVNFVDNIESIYPVPPGVTFVPGSIVAGNWTFTPVSGPTASGPLTVTFCATAGQAGCTATVPNGTTFLGPGGPLPYIEAGTGTAQFTAGGSLTTPAWSASFTTGTAGTVNQTVSEFQSSANLDPGSGTNLTVPVTAYPAVPVSVEPPGSGSGPTFQSATIASATVTPGSGGPTPSAGGSPRIFLSSNSNLINQQTIFITGTGFAPNQFGTVVECNLAANQPVSAGGPPSQPVGCTSASAGQFTADATGSFSTLFFRVHAGNIGDWETGLDSQGNFAATSAGAYPCPPTPTQVAAGVGCGIMADDSSGSHVTVPITVIGPGPATLGGIYPPLTTTQSVTLPSTAPSATTAATTSQSVTQRAVVATTSGAGTLPFTGVGSGLWLIGFAGMAALFVGYLTLTVYRRPRRLAADAWGSLARAFGADPGGR